MTKLMTGRHVRSRSVGQGWYRGPAIARFDCDECDRPILEGDDLATRTHNGTFTFLHGDCYDGLAAPPVAPLGETDR